MSSLHVLVMAGGSGTRFWPKSRAARPKQLLALWDDQTLLEHTVARFARDVPQKNIWIVTTEALVAASKSVLAARFPDVRFLGEPVARNTSACILWGVREIAQQDPGAVVAVMPADHYIADEKAFERAVAVAVDRALLERGAGETGAIVTIGIKPTRPETGFGYIEVDGKIPSAATPEALRVKRFVEKPDSKTAAQYINSGRYAWNAGMFIFSAKTALDAFTRAMPALSNLFAGGPAVDAYGKITKADAVSFDYGVMERAAGLGIPVYVVPSECGWNDVGSFPALEEIGRSELGEVVKIDSSSNVVQTDDGLVALLGVNDLVVVRDRGVVLVASKDRAQDVKLLLEKIKTRFPEQL